MTDQTLNVSEVFGPTIQGEGPYVGHPATFLRLMGCNLRCEWCDTPYTWDGSRYDLRKEGRKMEVAQVAAMLRDRATGLVVITGGEPMLQQRGIMELARVMGAGHGPEDVQVHIETAGTIAPFPMPVSYVVSPKLDHSGNSLEMRYAPHAIEAFNGEHVLGWKFVCQVPGDLMEVDALVQKHRLSPVYIMPEGKYQTEWPRMEALAQAAISRGYRLTPRLHLDIWGDERGH
jgi:7-cyano-7-deazaguanosine (preQ0) biosynthesis protein QueE